MTIQPSSINTRTKKKGKDKIKHPLLFHLQKDRIIRNHEGMGIRTPLSIRT